MYTLKGREGPDSTTIGTTVLVEETTLPTVIEGFRFVHSAIQISCAGGSPIIRENVFDVRDPCPSYAEIIGVRCRNGAAPRIEGNTFQGWCAIPEAGALGVVSEGGSSPLIIGNTFTDDRAVRLTGSGSAARVIGNIFLGTGCAVWTGAGSSDTLRGNEFNGAGIGVELVHAVDVSVISNDFIDCHKAFYLMNQSMPRVRDNRMSSNDTNMRLYLYSEPVVVDAERNWWGTTIEEEIQESIEFAASAEGCSVDFNPWCLDPACTSTPVLLNAWGSIKKLFRD